MTRPCQSMPLAALIGLSSLGLVMDPDSAFAEASSLTSMVQAYCLAAFQQEMWQAGKVAPKGMADFACRCVVDRLTEGTSLSLARNYCRESTARRYSM